MPAAKKTVAKKTADKRPAITGPNKFFYVVGDPFEVTEDNDELRGPFKSIQAAAEHYHQFDGVCDSDGDYLTIFTIHKRILVTEDTKIKYVEA